MLPFLQYRRNMSLKTRCKWIIVLCLKLVFRTFLCRHLKLDFCHVWPNFIWVIALCSKLVFQNFLRYIIWYIDLKNLLQGQCICLYHFIVLILIIHVLWCDTRQEKNYFITKVIDKRTKIKWKCCQAGGLNLCPLITSVFPKLKIVIVLLS